MEPFLSPRRIRVALSTLAAIAATLICIAQRHVQIILTEPRTYASPLHHKCGLLMIGCLAWAAFELKQHFMAPALPRAFEAG